MEVLSAEDWGLVVYDEVHLLPAPVFRMTADIQAAGARAHGYPRRRTAVRRCFQPDRPEALRRTMARYRGAGLDSAGSFTEVRVTLTTRADVLRASRKRGPLPAGHGTFQAAVIERLCAERCGARSRLS